MNKKRAIVIAPGRGTYNKEELGYLSRLHSDKSDLVEQIDAYRKAQGQTPISDLDGAEKFALKEHTRGDNASPLIYACAYSDFLSINRDEYEIVAVTGNSMGWYITLACAGAADFMGGTKIINTMGTFMQESLMGGQLIYICVDENWHEVPGRHQEVLGYVADIEGLYTSIELGGMFVFGGTEEALKKVEAKLDKQDMFPFRLVNHAAFHTPLQQPISEKALQHFSKDIIGQPEIPMIDGRGAIWMPHSSDPAEIFDYTFGHQVIKPYDFTKAVQVGVKEFAPDALIILGPGTTLGGAVAQSLIKMNWDGIDSKDSFIKRQKSDPYLLAMGIESQRKLVV